MWLGECGYVPGVDELLREAGIRYFFVDTHGILFADRRPVYGVYAPLYCPSGVAAFGRDTESSRAGVERARRGTRAIRTTATSTADIGFDLPLGLHRPYVASGGHRMATGFKYHAITHDKLHDKWVYDAGHRAAARRRARHALSREAARAGATLAPAMDRPPIIVSPYDAELYGHWWFEGLQFLDDLFRQIHYNQDEIDHHHARRVPRCAIPPTSWRSPERARGGTRVQRVLAQRDQRLGVPPPARGWPSA